MNQSVGHSGCPKKKPVGNFSMAWTFLELVAYKNLNKKRVSLLAAYSVGKINLYDIMR